MLGINYFKAEPNEYARVSKGGKIKKEGKGITSIYFPHRTSIEVVSTTTIDQPFEFIEITKDNQEISLQGGFLYRIEEPKKILETYNFSINPKSKTYMTEDNTKLPEHILQIIRADSRKIVQKSGLEEIIVMSEDLSKNVSKEILEKDSIKGLGIKVEMIYFDSITPNPEISKALGAEYRELLLQKADKASYSRRAKAVEEEKAIKKNELTNEIELEEKRKEYVKLQGENTLAEAEYNANAQKKTIELFKDMDSDRVRAYALLELGKNAEKIESLTITPDLVSAMKEAVK